LERARVAHGAASFVRADALALPFAPGSFGLALDRGCFHYLSAGQWPGYAAEVWRVLRPGGRLLLRACLTSAGARNVVTEAGLARVFAGWNVDSLGQEDLVSDTRAMAALVLRLSKGPGGV
jgi:SAM-dependent methyltransferase